jgi:hypothetical protein
MSHKCKLCTFETEKEHELMEDMMKESKEQDIDRLENREKIKDQ